MNPKILFIAPHRPGRSPSQRYRIEQFIPLLEENHIPYTYAYLLSPSDDKIFYSKGKWLLKVFILVKCLIKRFFHLKYLFSHDVIFIQRESYFLGFIFFERIAKILKKHIIYDVDDALWIPDTSEGNRFWSFLKSKTKTFRTARLASAVFAGNEWLAEQLIPYNRNTIYLPTVVDTEKYFPSNTEKHLTEKIPVIGWIGSPTTLKHLITVFPVLDEIYKEKKFRFILCSGKDAAMPQTLFPIEFVEWAEDSEVHTIQKFDFGIMPLPDENWTNGKCGLKALVCMACGKPVVASHLGANPKIISHGIDGFLAKNPSEWKKFILKLIDDHDLIRTMGKNARKKTEEYFSVKKWEEAWMKVLINKQFK
ncbi:MAG: glycosyltransferase family 4 protein [Bacteroidia bacterium]|nr:glycosyltransferase family 4 protein [Bacteroidia bacterium]